MNKFPRKALNKTFSKIPILVLGMTPATNLLLDLAQEKENRIDSIIDEQEEQVDIREGKIATKGKQKIKKRRKGVPDVNDARVMRVGVRVVNGIEQASVFGVVCAGNFVSTRLGLGERERVRLGRRQQFL